MDWKVVAIIVFIIFSSACISETEENVLNETEINQNNFTKNPLEIKINETMLEAYDLNLSLCLKNKEMLSFFPVKIANIPREIIPDKNYAILRVLNFSRRGVFVLDRTWGVYANKYEGKLRNFLEIFVEEYVDSNDYEKEYINLDKDLSGKSFKKVNLNEIEIKYREYFNEVGAKATKSEWYFFLPKSNKIGYIRMGGDIKNELAPLLLKNYLYEICLNQ